MGSFTELTLAFTFSSDTPSEIIGAFAEWRIADEEWRTGKAAPELPLLETSFGDDPFDADMHPSFSYQALAAPASHTAQAAGLHV